MPPVLRDPLCGLFYRKGVGAEVQEEMVGLSSSFYP